MAKKIEVEGGELALQGDNGSVAIIPKYLANRVKGYLDNNDHNSINAIVSLLPKYSSKAENGTLIPTDPPKTVEITAERSKSTGQTLGNLQPTIYNFKPGTYYRNGSSTCNTPNCLEWATTALGNLSGLPKATFTDEIGYGSPKLQSKYNYETDKEASFGAWHQRDLVEKAGGKVIWEEGSSPDYKAYQIGDMVSMRDENFGMSRHAGDIQGINREKNVRHAGVIVGFGEDGRPILEHNISGTLFREYLDDIQGGHYRAASVYRTPQFMEGNIANESAQGQYLSKANREAWANDLGQTFPMTKDENVMPWLRTYATQRQALGSAYNMSPEFADTAFRNIMGIGIQESNLDNSWFNPNRGFMDKAGDYAKQAVLGDSWASKLLKSVAKPIASIGERVTERDVAKNKRYNQERGLLPDIAPWRKEIEIAKLIDSGTDPQVAAEQVLAKYGKPESTFEPSNAQSQGTFKIKDVPSRAENIFNISDSGDRFSRRFYKTKEGELQAVYAIYSENYSRAKETFPDATEQELHKVATLAHNMPGAAFDKEYFDFYIRGKGNPDTNKYNSHYVTQVGRYADTVFKPYETP